MILVREPPSCALMPTSQEQKINGIRQAIPGIEFETAECKILTAITDMEVLSCYKRPDKLELSDIHHMQDLFDLPLGKGFVLIAFIPTNEKELEHAKAYVERALSKKEIRETHSAITEAFGRRASSSDGRETYSWNRKRLLYLTAY